MTNNSKYQQKTPKLNPVNPSKDRNGFVTLHGTFGLRISVFRGGLSLCSSYMNQETRNAEPPSPALNMLLLRWAVA